jgi:GGDEF domain-containing protein
MGVVPLVSGGGLILGLGSALTAALFLGIARLPAVDQPPASTLATGQALMGIVWATLYAWFSGASAGGAVLSVGMFISAITLALPGASLSALARLMVTAAAASLLTTLLHQVLPVASGPVAAVIGRLDALLPSFVLVVLLTVVYFAARTLATAREELQARNAELQAGIQRITRHAERDHLTNSYNRESILSGEPLCVCLLDIDHFKNMNDRFGHQTGDRILAAFARRVRGALRTMDTVNSGGYPATPGVENVEPIASGRSAFGRVGGEEFIVLLPGTSLGGALKCAERVRKAVVRRPFDGLHQVTVSIGIAEYRPGETVSSLVGRADEALYGAKNSGRNRVHCATTDGGPNAIVMPSFADTRSQ